MDKTITQDEYKTAIAKVGERFTNYRGGDTVKLYVQDVLEACRLTVEPAPEMDVRGPYDVGSHDVRWRVYDSAGADAGVVAYCGSREQAESIAGTPKLAELCAEWLRFMQKGPGVLWSPPANAIIDHLEAMGVVVTEFKGEG